MTINETRWGWWRRARPATAAGLLLALTMGNDRCGGGETPIPPEEEDEPPVIRLGHLFVNGSGTLDPWESSSVDGPTATIRITEASECIPHLAVTANAENLGGVQDLSIVVSREGLQEPIYQVALAVRPDENGEVPRQLSIIGHDGNGAPGPLLLDMSYDGEVDGCLLAPAFTVTAEATNFHGQVTQLRETIYGLNNRCCP